MNKKYTIIGLLFCAVIAVKTMDTPSEFTIYGSEGANKSITVPLEVLQLSSTLKGMIEDLGDISDSAIPINNFSTATLKDVMELLKKYNESSNSLEQLQIIASAYSIAQLVEVINCAHYLGIHDSILRVFRDIVVAKIESDYQFTAADYEVLKECNADFVKYFIATKLVPAIISRVKVKSLKKDEFEKKWFIENLPTGAQTFASCGIFMNDDQWVALGSTNNATEIRQVNIYDIENRSVVLTLACDVPLNNLIAYKNKYVVAVEDMYMGRGVRIWNITDPHNVQSYDYRHPQGRLSVQTMGFSLDGRHLVLVCDGIRDNIVVIDMNAIDWDNEQPTLDTDTVVFFTEQVGHKEDKIFFIPDTSTCIIATPSLGNMRFVTLNYQTKEISYTFVHQRKGTMRSVLNFSKDGNFLISFNDVLPKQKKIEIFDMSAMELVNRFDGPQETIVSITLSADNQWAVCMSDAGKLFIYDAIQQTLLSTINGIYTQNSLNFSADGNQILLAGSDPGTPYGFSGLLWTILTEEESSLLQVLYDCTIDQLIVVHRLCSQLATKGFALLIPDSNEMKIFSSLSKEMQDFLTHMGVKIKQTWSEWLINSLPNYMQIKQ
jgi:WD40 repeat protein